MHLMAEAMSRAYADRSEYLGDSDFVNVPLKGLTSKKYAEELRATIDQEHATPSATIKPGKPLPYESDQTTHFSVVDAEGNAVSNTYTLNFRSARGWWRKARASSSTTRWTISPPSPACRTPTVWSAATRTPWRRTSGRSPP